MLQNPHTTSRNQAFLVFTLGSEPDSSVSTYNGAPFNEGSIFKGTLPKVDEARLAAAIKLADQRAQHFQVLNDFNTAFQNDVAQAQRGAGQNGLPPQASDAGKFSKSDLAQLKAWSRDLRSTPGSQATRAAP